VEEVAIITPCGPCIRFVPVSSGGLSLKDYVNGVVVFVTSVARWVVL
jgi:hypothetical protein